MYKVKKTLITCYLQVKLILIQIKISKSVRKIAKFKLNFPLPPHVFLK